MQLVLPIYHHRIVKLRLTARGKNYAVLQTTTQPFVDAIIKRLGDKVFSVSAETMEEKSEVC